MGVLWIPSTWDSDREWEGGDEAPAVPVEWSAVVEMLKPARLCSSVGTHTSLSGWLQLPRRREAVEWMDVDDTVSWLQLFAG